MLERAGCPLHYWLGGPAERPLLVLMHGATMDHRMFNAQIPRLLPRYRVLVWDGRGQGRSQPLGARFDLETCAADLLAILDRHEVETAVLIGQSLGGYIAQQVYLAAPQRVQAMVILGSTPLAKAYSRFDVWALRQSLRVFKLWPYDHLMRVVAKFTAVRPEIQAYAYNAIRQISRDDFIKIWSGVTTAVNEKGMPDLRIRVPLLLTHGSRDFTGTIRRDMPRWADWEPDAEYAVIPQAGHNANQDNPDFFNNLLHLFLEARVG